MSNTAKAPKTEARPTPIMVPLNKLIEDPDNVRQTRSNDGIESLADNIHAEGLLQNLVVRKVKGGKYAVTGGERRRTALNVLVKRKHMKASDQIPCLLITEAHTSASLSENIHRMAMHPADQFVAWAKMQDDGLSVSEIAQRHGSSTRVVEQRLKLGRLSPVLLDALKADEISVDVACAFAATDEHKKQEEVYESLKARGWGMNAHTVKSALTGDEVRSTHKLAIFVGQEAYEKAGGEIRTDLFEDDVYFQDIELLNQLASEKLEAEAKQFKENGWAWIEIAFDRDFNAGSKMRLIHAHEIALSEADQQEKEKLEKRYEEIEEAAEDVNDQAISECDEIDQKLDLLRDKSLAYKSEEIAISGGFLSLSHDGTLDVRLGYVRREDDPKVSAEKRKAAEERANMPSQLTKSLRSDLSALRREIIQASFLKSPTIARDLLAFHTIRSVLSVGYHKTPFNLSAREGQSAASVSKSGDMGKFVGRKNTEKLIAKLHLDCFEIVDEVESFEAFHALTEKDKIALQAYAASLMLEPQLNDDPSLDPTLEKAAKLMSVDVSKYWTPDSDFFTRLTKKHIEEIASKVITAEFAQRHAESKKSDFAKAMGSAFNSGGKTTHLNKAAIDRIANWVPECMEVASV
ncbi:MAG: ParB N-terminal domain-containing protein [Verrucomicrobiota bacterium]